MNKKYYCLEPEFDCQTFPIKHGKWPSTIFSSTVVHTFRNKTFSGFLFDPRKRIHIYLICRNFINLQCSIPGQLPRVEVDVQVVAHVVGQDKLGKADFARDTGPAHHQVALAPLLTLNYF